ncbi:MAG: Xaa-Pro dipeptidase [Oligoflexia bacterium]|nr:Xaa-Pro dipeptidase [Oligoflexia bacterium]
MNFDSTLIPLYKDHLIELQKKISKILDELKMDSILIHSGQERIKYLDDSAYPFVANPMFVYFVPLTHLPNSFIYMEKGMRPTLYYYKKISYWFKMPEDPADFLYQYFDIKIIDEDSKMLSDLGDSKIRNTIYIGEYPEIAKNSTVNANFKACNPDDLITEIHYIRTFKSNYEQECIRRANKIAVSAHQRCAELFQEGKYSELDLHLEYLRSVGCSPIRMPFENIVAFNENAATLHYIDYNHTRPPLAASSAAKQNIYSMLLDAGAAYNGYAADITRTYSFNNSDDNSDFKALIDAVNEMQLNIIHSFTLNSRYTDHHQQAHIGIAQILIDFKMLKNISAEDAVTKKISNVFFPHGLGHFLGIQVHDVGGQLKNGKEKYKLPDDHPYLRYLTELRPGHVFTVEPGLYFIDSLLDDLKKSEENNKYVDWNTVDKFRKFGGIRIEDDIIIKEDGQFENITRKLLP